MVHSYVNNIFVNGGWIKGRSARVGTYVSSGIGHMIDTGYYTRMISFNCISLVKPGGSVSIK